jgi:hypothetical protein
MDRTVGRPTSSIQDSANKSVCISVGAWKCVPEPQRRAACGAASRGHQRCRLVLATRRGAVRPVQPVGTGRAGGRAGALSIRACWWFFVEDAIY